MVASRVRSVARAPATTWQYRVSSTCRSTVPRGVDLLATEPAGYEEAGKVLLSMGVTAYTAGCSRILAAMIMPLWVAFDLAGRLPAPDWSVVMPGKENGFRRRVDAIDDELTLLGDALVSRFQFVADRRDTFEVRRRSHQPPPQVRRASNRQDTEWNSRSSAMTCNGSGGSGTVACRLFDLPRDRVLR